MFPLRLDEVDRYLLRRLALERGQSANALVTMLVRAEIDQALPGAREAYQRRGEVAEHLLRRRGVDPGSAEYQAARRGAAPARCSTPSTAFTATRRHERPGPAAGLHRAGRL